MASKFVTLVEVAERLGITPEQVNEIRQRGDLNGYRDGASWKFKPEDVEKIVLKGTSSSARAPDESDEIVLLGDSQEISESPMDLPIDPDVDEGSDDDVVLLSEFELEESSPSASNTVIGKPGAPLSSFDSDIKLVADGGDEGSSSASKTSISPPGSPQSPGESAIKLETESFDWESSSRTFVGKPGESLSPDESAIRLQSGSEDLDNPSSTMIGKPGQPMGPGESVVKLGAFEDEDFDVKALPIDPGKSGTIPPPIASGSSIRIAEPPPVNPVVDSGITLGEDHYSDDDFVLGGPGSDITLSPGDSGISLVDPADSGLSLDAPIELRSATASAGDLGAAGSGEELDADFDSDEVMALKTSDEFLLTPMAAEGEESSDDSGSQVIALDSDSAFESSEASMFGSVEGSMSTMLEEDVGAGGGMLSEGALGAATAPAAFATAGGVPAAAGANPYPIWVVLLLGMCLLFLALCGMMMYDLVRNMWSWNGPYRVNSSIMDTILGYSAADKQSPRGAAQQNNTGRRPALPARTIRSATGTSHKSHPARAIRKESNHGPRGSLLSRGHCYSRRGGRLPRLSECASFSAANAEPRAG